VLKFFPDSFMNEISKDKVGCRATTGMCKLGDRRVQKKVQQKQVKSCIIDLMQVDGDAMGHR
jgi:hypothetical protein